MADTIFYNCDCIFVEYMDIIKCPGFLLAHACRMNEKLNEIVNLDLLKSYTTPQELFEWYVNRKNKNIFKEISKIENVPDELYDELFESQITSSDYFFKQSNELKIVNAIRFAANQKLIDNVYIYNEFDSEYIRQDINEIFNGNPRCKFVYGDFKTVIEENKITSNSTFILSDIDKVQILYDMKLLHLSSLMLPIEYRYNKKNMHDFKLDFEEMLKNQVFKICFYACCTDAINKENKKS